MTGEQLTHALYWLHECTIDTHKTHGTKALDLIAKRMVIPQELARNLLQELIKIKAVAVDSTTGNVWPIVGILP